MVKSAIVSRVHRRALRSDGLDPRLMGGVRRVVTTLAAVAVSVVLAACSSGSETVEADAELVPVEAGQATPAPASDVPAFEGPWSVELARAWICLLYTSPSPRD